MARRTKYKAREEWKAVPVGMPEPPQAEPVFEASDEARMYARVHLRSQVGLLGKVKPQDVRLCLFGAALLGVEAGIEASKLYDAFKEEHERVSREFDKWKLGEPERIKAEIGLAKGSK